MNSYSRFESWEYLNEYYSELGEENKFLLNFYAKAYSAELTADKLVLDVGGGPTIYQLISASRYAKAIVFTEFLSANRQAIQNWLRDSDDSFVWDSYFRYVSELEGGDKRDWKDIAKRLRSKIAAVEPVDLRTEDPFSDIRHEKFDVVSSAFCIEGITPDIGDVEAYLEKIIAPIRPGGALVITIVLNCRRYRIAEKYFPCACIDDHSFIRLLEKNQLRIRLHETIKACPPRGYEGISAVCAIKS